ncbi:MAG: hypothetical protein JWR26_3540 [Pedosphaera sp.]|nr:hypothetical protein [Pedosphaera sp.]
MSGKLYKSILAAVAVVLLVGVSLLQKELTRERQELGLTRYTELKGAPPVLALTTVALGGFRGLVSNALWIRANELQENDKYFEMVQLADWITKLEPHFTQVWLVQAWNMAYNISVKFKDPEDRWRWVERGIELLRDEGLRYNPNDVLIHRELAWFFQHKMGQNMDDAHILYKQEWANEMNKVIGRGKINFDELMNPTTEDAIRRSILLTNKYKMNPVLMKKCDELYGPLEWRLPEASAIYWAAEGLENAKLNERQIKQDDLITLRRVIYQSMQMSFQRGRLVRVALEKADKVIDFAPNLEIVPKVSAAYEQAMIDDPKNRDHIETAHRNFVKDAVYFFYTYNREADAIKWYKYLIQKYPDKPLLDNAPESMPGTLSVEEYAIARIQDEVNSPGHDKAEAIIKGLETTALMSLATGEDDRFTGMERLAQKILDKYNVKISTRQGPLYIPPLKEIRQEVLKSLLGGGLPEELAAQLATKTGQSMPKPAPPETPPPAGK